MNTRPTYTVFDAVSHLPLRLVEDAIEASRFAPEGAVCDDPATGKPVYLMCGAHKSLRSAFTRGTEDATADRAPLFRRVRDGYVPNGGSESDEETIAEWSQEERRAYLDGYLAE